MYCELRSVAELLSVAGACAAAAACLVVPGLAGHAAQTSPRGAMLLFFTSVYVIFTCTLLLIFALTMLFNGATGVTLPAFLVVWLVPTYLLTRLWRRKAR